MAIYSEGRYVSYDLDFVENISSGRRPKKRSRELTALSPTDCVKNRLAPGAKALQNLQQGKIRQVNFQRTHNSPLFRCERSAWFAKRLPFMSSSFFPGQVITCLSEKPAGKQEVQVLSLC